MMKMDEILKNLKLNNDIMKNIEISKNEDDDFLKSKFCLFRGSYLFLSNSLQMLSSIFKL